MRFDMIFSTSTKKTIQKQQQSTHTQSTQKMMKVFKKRGDSLFIKRAVEVYLSNDTIITRRA